MYKFKIVSSLVAGGLLSIAAVAAANAASADAPTMVVRYKASILETDQGVQRLYNRLVAAAETVCPAPGARLLVSAGVAECRKKAVTDAVAQIHNQRLAAVADRSNKNV